MQKIMYNNYREPKGSFTHSLRDTDIHLAATLHPVKNASFQYRLHKYFLMRDSLRVLRNRLTQLQRQLNDVATELKVTVTSTTTTTLRGGVTVYPSPAAFAIIKLYCLVIRHRGARNMPSVFE